MDDVLDSVDYEHLSEVIINDIVENRWVELSSCPNCRSDQYEIFMEGLLRCGPEPYPEIIREKTLDILSYREDLPQGRVLTFNKLADLNVRALDEITTHDQNLIVCNKEFVISRAYGSLVKLKVKNDKTRKLTMHRYYHASRFFISGKHDGKDMSFVGRKITHGLTNSALNSLDFKPGQIVYNVFSKEYAKVEAIAKEVWPHKIMVRQWSDVLKKYSDHLIECPLANYRGSYDQIVGEFKSQPNMTFAIGQAVRLRLQHLADALVWAGMKVDHPNFDVMKQIIAGDATVIDILRDKPGREQVVIRFKINAGIAAANMIDWNFPVQPAHLEAATATQGVLPSIPASSWSGQGSRYQTTPTYDYWKEEEMKKKEKERIRKERDEADKAAGPYNLDRYKDKIIRVKDINRPELKLTLDGKLGVVSRIDNVLGHVIVDIFNHKTKTEYLFRASQGNLDDTRVEIVSDVIAEYIDGSKHAAEV